MNKTNLITNLNELTEYILSLGNFKVSIVKENIGTEICIYENDVIRYVSKRNKEDESKLINDVLYWIKYNKLEFWKEFDSFLEIFMNDPSKKNKSNLKDLVGAELILNKNKITGNSI